MKDSDLIINVSHLSKSFDNKVAVYDFSLKAKKGEIIGFLGPNGSGKTTTIRMLCGLLKPDSGEGSCLGYNLFNEGDVMRSYVGYMTQRFSLYLYLTVYQNLNFIAQALGISNKKERIKQIIEQFDLGKRQHQKTSNLSGGLKQRLALAAAILNQPQLLLLDEPTAGVDPQARHDFWQIINQLAAEGMTILVSTHYMDEAEHCSRIIYLAYGRIIASGTTHDITSNANISTWQVSGKDINALSKALKQVEGVEQVIQFGSSLHVFGQDKALMIRNLRSYMLNLDYNWKGVIPTLEDVFIKLVANVKDERFD